MSRTLGIAGALLAALARARPAGAHGAGERYDLPVPLALWIAGAAAAAIVAFVVAGRLVRRPTLAGDGPRIDLLRWPIGRVLVHPSLWRAGRVASVALLVLVVAAGAFGHQNPTRNPAPAAVWVVWWIGTAYLSALLGGVWRVLDPWSALYAAGERLLGGGPAGRRPYPRRLGAWPAVALFGAFAWTALIFEGRAIPAQLALLILGYSLVTGTGMAVFGRTVWLTHGDPFTAVFELFARLAPLELRVRDTRRCRDCAHDCAGPRGRAPRAARHPRARGGRHGGGCVDDRAAARGVRRGGVRRRCIVPRQPITSRSPGHESPTGVAGLSFQINDLAVARPGARVALLRPPCLRDSGFVCTRS